MALQSEESRTEPRPTQEDEAKITPKSLEERYIGLLEKKIALLEEQLLSAKDDAKGKTEGADGPQAPDVSSVMFKEARRSKPRLMCRRGDSFR